MRIIVDMAHGGGGGSSDKPWAGISPGGGFGAIEGWGGIGGRIEDFGI